MTDTSQTQTRSLIDGPILFLRPDKAGDLIKTLPALRAIRAELPDLDFHILTSQNNHSLLEAEPGIQSHCLPPDWRRLKAGSLRTMLVQKGMPAVFSKAINLLGDPFPEVEKLLASIAAVQKYSPTISGKYGQEIQCIPLPSETAAGRDESTNIAYTLSQALGVEIVSKLSSFPKAPELTQEDRKEAMERMGVKEGTWLGFCPFAGLENRNPPIRRWEKFIGKVARSSEHQKFFIFGTPIHYQQMMALKNRAKNPHTIGWFWVTLLFINAII
jgi:ADP-heptose:LPS heptosyltransferase